LAAQIQAAAQDTAMMQVVVQLAGKVLCGSTGGDEKTNA
jgi:hypothetical protein